MIQNEMEFCLPIQYPKGIMRWAKSYSIVDHELLHGGYLGRLSHEALVLYLFLVVVGDRDGRSYYSEVSVMGILRFEERQFRKARLELIQEGLIRYSRPYWRVENLKGGGHGAAKTNSTVPQRRGQTELPADSEADRAFAKTCLENISRVLRG